MSDGLRLYSYWRSSAAYRVRIGLHLKGIAFETVPVHLVRDGGEQHSARYRAANPQQLVPALEHDGATLVQSLAILEYLDEAWPQAALLPADPLARQRARALAQVVACDIHPLGNLRVLQYLEQEWAIDPPRRTAWLHRWMGEGFAAFEAMLAASAHTGRFCIGDAPTIADCCLVPQLYNAHRFGVDLAPYPTLARIEQACLALPAFDAARPERQPDAPPESRA